MDILEQLAVNTEREYTISGVKMNLAPLPGDMMLAFGDTEGKEVETLYKMVTKTLQAVDSTITYDGVVKLPTPVLMELVAAIQELNGLENKKAED